MDNPKPREQARITIYMPKDEYLELRSRLIGQGGRNVSAWFREIVREFLTQSIPKNNEE